MCTYIDFHCDDFQHIHPLYDIPLSKYRIVVGLERPFMELRFSSPPHEISTVSISKHIGFDGAPMFHKNGILHCVLICIYFFHSL